MSTGKKFEELIVKSCQHFGMDITRLKDAGFTGKEVADRRFTSRNICDFIAFSPKSRAMFYIEAKSRKSSLVFDDVTQAKDLTNKYEYCRSKGMQYLVHPILLIEFSDTQQYFAMGIECFNELKATSTKKSFNAKDCLRLIQEGKLCREIPTSIPKGKRTPVLYMEGL